MVKEYDPNLIMAQVTSAEIAGRYEGSQLASYAAELSANEDSPHYDHTYGVGEEEDKFTKLNDDLEALVNSFEVQELAAKLNDTSEFKDNGKDSPDQALAGGRSGSNALGA